VFLFGGLLARSVHNVGYSDIVEVLDLDLPGQASVIVDRLSTPRGFVSTISVGCLVRFAGGAPIAVSLTLSLCLHVCLCPCAIASLARPFVRFVVASLAPLSRAVVALPVDAVAALAVLTSLQVYIIGGSTADSTSISTVDVLYPHTNYTIFSGPGQLPDTRFQAASVSYDPAVITVVGGDSGGTVETISACPADRWGPNCLSGDAPCNFGYYSDPSQPGQCFPWSVSAAGVLAMCLLAWSRRAERDSGLASCVHVCVCVCRVRLFVGQPWYGCDIVQRSVPWQRLLQFRQRRRVVHVQHTGVQRECRLRAVRHWLRGQEVHRVCAWVLGPNVWSVHVWR
jgi:hypothetical protein